MTVRESIRTFRDLRVWQLGMDLVEQIYCLTKEFPKQEMYGLSSQIQRAAVSIPSNIAEGHTREHSREYLQYISLAQGSLAELQTQLEIAGRLQYITREKLEPVLDEATALAKQIYSLRNAVMKSLTPNPQPLTPR